MPTRRVSGMTFSDVAAGAGALSALVWGLWAQAARASAQRPAIMVLFIKTKPRARPKGSATGGATIFTISTTWATSAAPAGAPLKGAGGCSARYRSSIFGLAKLAPLQLVHFPHQLQHP